MLVKHFYGPILEKLLAEGAIVEYEFDEEAVHTSDPNMIYLDLICPNAEGLDKVNKALDEGVAKNPLLGPALDRLIDWSKHRDGLLRSNVTYK